MPRRLVSALATLFLTLQFVFLGIGFTCIMPEGTGNAMPGMAQIDMGDQQPASATPAPGEGHEDCSVPWMPADCQVMAPCAPAAVTPTVVSALPLPSLSHETTRLIMLAPPSRGIPPELPPPRA